MIKKRYLIKIYDTELGGEYEFDSDHIKISSEKGLIFNKDSGILESQETERHYLFFWSGFENWEEFKSEILDE